VPQPDALATIYAGWEAYQGRLVRAVASLTPEQFALRAAPNLRSIGEIAVHIAKGRAQWLHYALNEGTEATAVVLAWRAVDGQDPTAIEIARGLESTWAALQAVMARWTPEELARAFTIMLNGEERTVTRQWVIWHFLEHDLHHGGELALCLGVHGLKGSELI
jgi:uncharacterized damage-inducible protein DinB